MAPDQDGSGRSPAPKAEGASIPLAQVKAMAEGGLLDEVLLGSPAFAKINDRLTTMEARASEITGGLAKINEQLTIISQAFQPPPAAEDPAPSPGEQPAGPGSLAAWAPIINALAVKALGGGEAQPQNLAGAFAQFLELFKHFTAFQAEVNKSNVITYRIMQQAVRETEPAKAVAHLAAEVAS